MRGVAPAVGINARSARLLREVVPALSWRVQRVLIAMAALGFPMVVTDGLRTTDQQQALWRQGRETPGKIVTQLDGIAKRSRHQASGPSGLGRAVDCAFQTPDGGVTWDSPAWPAYGACAEALGLEWGGRWTRFPDRPHVEWQGAEDD